MTSSASTSRTCRGQSCSSPVTLRSRSERRTSTQQNKRWTCHALFQRSNNVFACELVLTSRNMLLLIAESAKDVRMLTRIQKTNEVTLIRPIVIGVQMAALPATTELAAAKVFIQRASTLLRMRLNQKSIVGKCGMVWVHQEHQRLATIWIVFDLIGLRM